MKNGLGLLFDPADYFNECDKALEKIEPAWAKAAVALRFEKRFGHGQTWLPMDLVKVYEILEVHRRRFEAGDTLQLLIAIQRCGMENVPMPTWLALAYDRALRSFLSAGGVSSLDDAFKSPHLPTNTPKKHATAQQDWLEGGEIMRAVWDAAKADETLHSLDAAIERAYETHRFSVKKTNARKLFNMVEKSQIEYLRAMGSNTQPLSRLFAKRRKDATE